MFIAQFDDIHSSSLEEITLNVVCSTSCFFRFMLVSCVVLLESRSTVWLSAWRKVDRATR